MPLASFRSRRLGWLLAAWLLLFVVPAARAAISAADGGVKFTYENAAAGQVYWAGEFNGWNTTANPFTKEGDVWSIVIPLPPGEHQYKLVVDGAWVADPDNPVTKGDYGNSAVTVGADGKPQTGGGGGTGSLGGTISNLNPKIRLGGRLITLYQARRDPLQDDRFELRRPDFDLDLDFNIRMNDVLDARVLTNIRGEREDVPFWQTRLNFDRGNMRLHSDKIELYGFDNDRLDAWGDPLDLVGKVGIYDHAFGYFEQGMQARRTIAGTDVKLLYADSFRNGGTSRPAGLTPDQVALFGVRLDEGREITAGYNFTDTDDNKDVLAFRAARKLGGVDAGLQARLDRGFNPGYARVTERKDDGDELALEGPTYERWRGLGANLGARWAGWNWRAEYLNGRNHLEFQSGTAGTERTVDDGDTTTVELTGNEAKETFTIASDDRATLGAGGAALGLDLDLAWEYHGTDITPIGNDSARYLDNRMTTWSARAGRTFAIGTDRALDARLAFAFTDFEYDDGSPWTSQFWFDRRNYWLEAGEHEVSVDRMTLLGGNDVVSWRPSISVDVLTDPGLKLRYAGTIGAPGWDSAPKYVESLFQATLQITSRTRLYSDTRWVKYNDPVLDLHHGYVSTFLELGYQFTPGIHFALSWGVDPYVIDDPVNEYAYIGRDVFLFDRMANGSQAARDYYSLGTFLPLAEEALEDVDVIQLEAVIQF